MWVNMSDLTILYRPVGPEELALIEASGWTAFPPRKPEQPIFYPVCNEEYAAWISKHWNVRDYGAGYVTRFAVDSDFLKRTPSSASGQSMRKSSGFPPRNWMSSIG